jgi:hypothetical protein
MVSRTHLKVCRRIMEQALSCVNWLELGVYFLSERSNTVPKKKSGFPAPLATKSQGQDIHHAPGFEAAHRCCIFVAFSPLCHGRCFFKKNAIICDVAHSRKRESQHRATLGGSFSKQRNQWLAAARSPARKPRLRVSERAAHRFRRRMLLAWMPSLSQYTQDQRCVLGGKEQAQPRQRSLGYAHPDRSGLVCSPRVGAQSLAAVQIPEQAQEAACQAGRTCGGSVAKIRTWERSGGMSEVLPLKKRIPDSSPVNCIGQM